MSQFDGVDLIGITAELKEFVHQAKPVNDSGNGFITASCSPACGRPHAIELGERVLPILTALYPKWRDENPENRNFEFGAIRDASQRLLARISSYEQVEKLLIGHDASPRLSGSELHELVWRAASAQWSTGHLQEAVLAASKAVNSMLQSRLGRRDISDVKLVRETFSDSPPTADKPRLRFVAIEDDQTRESMRQGVMSFGAGCFQAIRNPVGHLPNDEHELSEQEALERLAALSLLARWIEQAEIEHAS
jgi:uncharacterized protein (TIGR02391 family)